MEKERKEVMMKEDEDGDDDGVLNVLRNMALKSWTGSLKLS